MPAMIRLATTNDKNGNPRRVFVLFSEGGEILGAWDESYAGNRAVPADLYDKARQAPSFTTTPKGYRDALTWGRTVLKAHPIPQVSGLVSL